MVRRSVFPIAFSPATSFAGTQRVPSDFCDNGHRAMSSYATNKLLSSYLQYIKLTRDPRGEHALFHDLQTGNRFYFKRSPAGETNRSRLGYQEWTDDEMMFLGNLCDASKAAGTPGFATVDDLRNGTGTSFADVHEYRDVIQSLREHAAKVKAAITASTDSPTVRAEGGTKLLSQMPGMLRRFSRIPDADGRTVLSHYLKSLFSNHISRSQKHFEGDGVSSQKGDKRSRERNEKMRKTFEESREELEKLCSTLEHWGDAYHGRLDDISAQAQRYTEMEKVLRDNETGALGFCFTYDPTRSYDESKNIVAPIEQGSERGDDGSSEDPIDDATEGMQAMTIQAAGKIEPSSSQCQPRILPGADP